MTFLQPLLLLALPLALAPVVIHLLNRMRFKTVDWAATRFLVQADRESTRWERIKRWLVLLLRVLALLLLILALSRPLAGGWMGWALGGAPDTVVVVIDRSASMRAGSGADGNDLRTEAIRAIGEGLEPIAGRSRVVLYDPVLAEFHEIADPSLLASMRGASASDAGVSFREVLRGVGEWCVAQTPGRTEVWLASDLQSASWDGPSESWKESVASLAAMDPPVRVRLLALRPAVADNDNTIDNSGLSLRGASRSEKGELLDLSVDRWGPGEPSLVLDGVRSALAADSGWSQGAGDLTVPVQREAGWGRIVFPPDRWPADDSVGFVYRAPSMRQIAIHAEEPRMGELLGLASAGGKREALIPVGDAFDASVLEAAWLLVWQGKLPSGEPAAAIETWTKSGGIAVFFPPATGDGGSFGGVTFGAVEESGAKVARWDRVEGPLADTREGYALPLDRLEVAKRVGITGASGHLAGFDDDRPFIAQQAMGTGAAFWVAVLPESEWSSLGDGRVLVPMLQRLADRGRMRTEQPAAVPVGPVPAAAAATPWRRVDQSGEGADPREMAGIYESGEKRVAVNTPLQERDPGVLDVDSATALLSPLAVASLSATGGRAGELQSEAWRALLFLLMIGLIAEAWLVLPTDAKGRPAKKAERAKELEPVA